MWQWVAVNFGPLSDERILRVLVLSFTGLAAAVQVWLAAFLASLMEITQEPVTPPVSAADDTSAGD